MGQETGSDSHRSSPGGDIFIPALTVTLGLQPVASDSNLLREGGMVNDGGEKLDDSPRGCRSQKTWRLCS